MDGTLNGFAAVPGFNIPMPEQWRLIVTGNSSHFSFSFCAIYVICVYQFLEDKHGG